MIEINSMLLAKSEYNKYLTHHINNVIVSYENIKDQLYPELRAQMESLIYNHDRSKTSPEEWYPYLNHFYLNDQYDELGNFDVAWNHHIHNNPHHWQYWILIDETNFGYKALNIPLKHIIEMLCDWHSFSDQDDGVTAYEWYNKYKDKMILSDKTRKLLDKYSKLFIRSL